MNFVLRPSASYRWINCAAAPSFEERAPEAPPSDAAREGTAAAWVADAVLKEYVPTAATLIGESHENQWLITSEMADHVQGYVDMIRSYGGTVTSEQAVRLSEFIAGTFDSSISGTVDSHLLRIIDLKYGFKLVEVFENTQEIIYAAAELMRLSNPAITHVELSIYQPRGFHPDGIHRKWLLTVHELWERAQEIIMAGAACYQPNPVATPGKHCGHCRAATSCAALAASNYAAYERVEDIRQRHMTADEISREMDFLILAESMLKARKSAVESEMTERLKKGEHIRRYYFSESWGNRKFTVPGDVVRAMTMIDPYELKLVTPSEMERRGASKEIVGMLSKRMSTGMTLKQMPSNAIDKAFSK